jgi:hypothetical protein
VALTIKIDKNKMLISIDPNTDIDENGHCVIPFGVKIIGPGAFDKSYDLKSVEIPNSVVCIGGSAFRRCKSLESIIIPNSVTEFGTYIFGHCRCLKSVKLPENMTQIPNWTFAGCSELKSIHIPDAVKTIGVNAFRASGLQSITIPASVRSVGSFAFKSCNELEIVSILAESLKLDENVFEQSDNIKTIEVKSFSSFAFNEMKCFNHCSDARIKLTEKDSSGLKENKVIR